MSLTAANSFALQYNKAILFTLKNEAFKHLQYFVHNNLRPQVQQLSDVDQDCDKKRQDIIGLLAKYVVSFRLNLCMISS